VDTISVILSAAPVILSEAKNLGLQRVIANEVKQSHAQLNDRFFASLRMTSRITILQDPESTYASGLIPPLYLIEGRHQPVDDRNQWYG